MRIASEEKWFPYASKLVCYIEVTPAGEVRQISSKSEKREAAVNAFAGKSQIYAVWPGQWRSDLFLIDDLEAFSEKNGL